MAFLKQTSKQANKKKVKKGRNCAAEGGVSQETDPSTWQPLVLPAGSVAGPVAVTAGSCPLSPAPIRKGRIPLPGTAGGALVGKCSHYN